MLAEAGVPAPGTRPSDWRAAVAPYVGSDVRRALFQLVTTTGLLAVSMVVMYLALDGAPLLTAVLVVPTAGLLVRTFIIMHDCAHGSFLPWRRVNAVIGAITGAVTLTPFDQWRREHALHHASSGDLERRGSGDVPTLTVREYLARSSSARRRYRILRHPATLLLGGPLHLMLGQRLQWMHGTGRRHFASVWGTNLAIVVLATAAVWLFGWRALLLVYLPVYYVAAIAGIWLFYVQHQFEDAHWTSHSDWDYATAALQGSSHLKLPPVLRWFTGNIGLHHVHHLAPRIPNYRLQGCHDANPLLHTAPELTVRTAMRTLKLALWDEDSQRLVRFADVATADPASPR